MALDAQKRPCFAVVIPTLDKLFESIACVTGGLLYFLNLAERSIEHYPADALADTLTNFLTAQEQKPAALRSISAPERMAALVQTIAFCHSLTADDFILTHNGVPQTLQLETDTDSQPLAQVVMVEIGGQGTRHLRDYDNLRAELDAVIGDVRDLVAVVSFDSKPRITQDSPTIRTPQQKQSPN
jgi:hypothetical protein